MEAARHKLRIREAPVSISRRAADDSKKPRNFTYPPGFFRTIVEVWLRQRMSGALPLDLAYRQL